MQFARMAFSSYVVLVIVVICCSFYQNTKCFSPFPKSLESRHCTCSRTMSFRILMHQCHLWRSLTRCSTSSDWHSTTRRSDTSSATFNADTSCPSTSMELDLRQQQKVGRTVVMVSILLPGSQNYPVRFLSSVFLQLAHCDFRVTVSHYCLHYYTMLLLVLLLVIILVLDINILSHYYRPILILYLFSSYYFLSLFSRSLCTIFVLMLF